LAKEKPHAKLSLDVGPTKGYLVDDSLGIFAHSLSDSILNHVPLLNTPAIFCPLGYLHFSIAVMILGGNGNPNSIEIQLTLYNFLPAT